MNAGEENEPQTNKFLNFGDNVMQHCSRPIPLFVVFILMPLCQLMAQSRMAVETASLHPGSNLGGQRTSPTPPKLDGPELYQVLFNPRRAPVPVPVLRSNLPLLGNSLADDG